MDGGQLIRPEVTAHPHASRSPGRRPFPSWARRTWRRARRALRHVRPIVTLLAWFAVGFALVAIARG